MEQAVTSARSEAGGLDSPSHSEQPAAQTAVVARKAGLAAALIGGAVFLWFTAQFIADGPTVFASEWVGLLTLQAGLAAAALTARGRGQISQSTMIAVFAALVLWTTISVANR